MMLFGHTTEIAIHATMYLASQPPGRLSPIHQIARRAGLKKPLLAKVIARLTRARLVRTYRGPGGGVELARPSDQMCLWTVVHAMEGNKRSERCALGFQRCSEEKPCPLHARWSSIQEQIRELLEETTIASIAAPRREGLVDLILPLERNDSL
ncbi:MAG: Rrf2 family transcriptional regulator [Acidobacteria bacterium]|nr:Rrf2 family transcriptional regulator [Acidobacteriota bacterium]